MLFLDCLLSTDFSQVVQASIFLGGTFGIKFLSAKLLDIKDDVSY